MGVGPVLQEAAPAAATGAPRAEGWDLDLAGAAPLWLSTAALLLSLASGQLVVLMLQQEGATVRRLKVCAYPLHSAGRLQQPPDSQNPCAHSQACQATWQQREPPDLVLNLVPSL